MKRYTKKLYYASLVKFYIALFVIALPLIAIKVVFIFFPHHAVFVARFFLMFDVVLLILGSCVYAIFHYSSIEKNVGKIEHLASIGHDLRSPLASLKCAIEEIRATPSSDAQNADAVHLLELATNRLMNIASDLLEMRSGTKAVQKTTRFSLHQLLEGLIAEYEKQVKGNQIIFLKYFSVENIILFGDSVGLERALGNLIKNALEAMQWSGAISVKTHFDELWATIAITDTGPGMTERMLKRIIRGGYTVGKQDGHGIGLTVVKDVVSSFGGTLTAQSEVGKGTTFVIRLPLPFQEMKVIARQGVRRVTLATGASSKSTIQLTNALDLFESR